MKYVVLTAARNEEELLPHTLRSMAAQTIPPLAWIVVSDGSTDRTDELVKEYAAKYPWIKLMRMPERKERQFAAKANCINTALASLQSVDFDFVANLDADTSFEPDYFEFVLGKFEGRPKLGVAGTPFTYTANERDDPTYTHQFANFQYVSGPCQVFRRKCFEEVGGYVPVRGGAVDWIAVTTARMKGWETRTFPEKTYLHHRKMGTANDHALMVRYKYGQKAYYVGGHPAWEILRGFFQMRQSPYVIGGIYFICGFTWAMVTRMKRPVSPELIQFHRKEQMARLSGIFTRRSRTPTTTPAVQK